MNIKTISERTGLPVRELRYAVDHGFLKGAPIEHHGRGNARELDARQALALVVGCYLKHADITRKGIKWMMEMIRDRLDQDQLSFEKIPGVKVEVDLATIREKLQ